LTTSNELHVSAGMVLWLMQQTITWATQLPNLTETCISHWWYLSLREWPIITPRKSQPVMVGISTIS